MRIALDSNRYSDLARGNLEVRDLVARSEEVFLPFVVLAELRGGFERGSRVRENERALAELLQLPNVAVLWPTEATIRIWARLYAQLCRGGTLIPIHDIWIAALVLEHDVLLATRDGHFEHLPQVPTI